MAYSNKKAAFIGGAVRRGSRTWMRLFFLILVPLNLAHGQYSFTIQPKEFQAGNAAYVLGKEITIKTSTSHQAEIRERLKLLEKKFTGTPFSVRLSSTKTPGDIRAVIIGDAVEFRHRRFEVPIQAEGYLLEVTPKGVLLLARDLMGIQWGLLRLKEIIDLKRRIIPSLLIHDWPDVSWRGVQITLPEEGEMEGFTRFVNEVLLPYQFNTVLLQADDRFQFKSHPEIKADNARSPGFCTRVSNYLKHHGLRVIPGFNCLGHQSGEKSNKGLLKAYPEFDETPELPFGDKRLYRRSWCPRHPKLPTVLYDMWDEMEAAFDAEHFHIGLNEVFHIASPLCPRCKTAAPWEIFLSSTMQYHAYFKGRGNTVLMWGDRLLDREAFQYSKYEASGNNTHPAIRFLPRDIIMCDWHTGGEGTFPSLVYFQNQGFRVLSCPGTDTNNIQALTRYAMKDSVRTNLFLGFLLKMDVPFGALADGFFGEERESDDVKKAVSAITLLGKLCWQGRDDE